MAPSARSSANLATTVSMDGPDRRASEYGSRATETVARLLAANQGGLPDQGLRGHHQWTRSRK